VFFFSDPTAPSRFNHRLAAAQMFNPAVACQFAQEREFVRVLLQILLGGFHKGGSFVTTRHAPGRAAAARKTISMRFSRCP